MHRNAPHIKSPSSFIVGALWIQWRWRLASSVRFRYKSRTMSNTVAPAKSLHCPEIRKVPPTSLPLIGEITEHRFAFEKAAVVSLGALAVGAGEGWADPTYSFGTRAGGVGAVDFSVVPDLRLSVAS